MGSNSYVRDVVTAGASERGWQGESNRHLAGRVRSLTYIVALVVSISTWFTAIRSPLWLDETVSYWQISAGLNQIWPRRLVSLCFPAYSYILWFSTKVIGTTEIAMRMLSVVAMLGAAYLLYLAASELFHDRELGIIATIFFCLNPVVITESIDVRPYAFGVLAINAAILIGLRLGRSRSLWLAAAFGVVAALIVWFHFLFAPILPALVICFFAVKSNRQSESWRQFCIAMLTFAIAFLPVLAGLRYLFHTQGSHVFDTVPRLSDLVSTLAPRRFLALLVVAALIHFLAGGARRQMRFDLSRVLICASLALIPLLILFGVSVATPLHIFIARHRLVAVPGIALCWALALSPLQPRVLRVLFVVAFVALGVRSHLASWSFGHHEKTWKYALEVVEKHASPQNEPVVICSDLPESNYVVVPPDSAKTSFSFAPLSYFKLSVPVVPLPRALNATAMRDGTSFLQQAEAKHQEFLAMAFYPSYPTLTWLSRQAEGAYTIRKLGTFDGVEVLEFIPLVSTGPQKR